MERLRRMLLLAAAVAPAACAPSPPASLAVEWATPFAALGLVSVDPPQEDIRIGDVFVYTTDPEVGSRRIGTVGRWATLPVIAEVEREYRGRPPWPQTPAPSAETGPPRWSEPAAPAGEPIFAAEAVPNRLRRIEGREEPNALIPSHAANLTQGTSWDDYKGVMVTISAAEMYGLALDKVPEGPACLARAAGARVPGRLRPARSSP